LEPAQAQWGILLVLAAMFGLLLAWLILQGYLNAYLASNHPDVLSRIGPPLRGEIDPRLRIHRGIAWFKFLVLLRFRALRDPKLNRICYAVLLFDGFVLVLFLAPVFLSFL